MRQVFKAVVERGLTWSGAAALHRRRMRGRVLVLAYHNIIPDDTPPFGDLANHLRLSAFAAQIAELRRTHDIVPLGETLGVRDWGRPRAAITFDDAYRGAVVHGVAELARHGLPATVFVAPAFLGGKSFWWDALTRPGAGLDPSLRARALGELRGADAEIRASARAAGALPADVPAVACAATEAELMQAASQPGISLGSHTWSHPNLTRLSPHELADELSRPLAWLRGRAPNVLPWIAYPYGLHDPAVEAGAAAAGYVAALGISGGWYAHAPGNRYALPRVNIPPGLSAPGFALRGAGLLTG